MSRICFVPINNCSVIYRPPPSPRTFINEVSLCSGGVLVPWQRKFAAVRGPELCLFVLLYNPLTQLRVYPDGRFFFQVFCSPIFLGMCDGGRASTDVLFPSLHAPPFNGFLQKPHKCIIVIYVCCVIY